MVTKWSWTDGISQMLFVGKSGRWERPLSLSLSWHSEPLSTWRRTVTYDFQPSVWISPLITVMWRRRHLSTVINGAISDWRRMCTTLFIYKVGQNRTFAPYMAVYSTFMPKTPCLYIYIYISGQPYVYTVLFQLVLFAGISSNIRLANWPTLLLYRHVQVRALPRVGGIEWCHCRGN